MSKGTDHMTREERLAAKLRENLRRRKAQARAMKGGADAERDSPETGLPNAPEDR